MTPVRIQSSRYVSIEDLGQLGQLRWEIRQVSVHMTEQTSWSGSSLNSNWSICFQVEHEPSDVALVGTRTSWCHSSWSLDQLGWPHSEVRPLGAVWELFYMWEVWEVILRRSQKNIFCSIYPHGWQRVFHHHDNKSVMVEQQHQGRNDSTATGTVHWPRQFFQNRWYQAWLSHPLWCPNLSSPVCSYAPYKWTLFKHEAILSTCMV